MATASFERCKRGVGRNYERSEVVRAVACARFLDEQAEKLTENSDSKVRRYPYYNKGISIVLTQIYLNRFIKNVRHVLYI